MRRPAPRLAVAWLPVKVLWSSTTTDPPPSFKMAPADPNMVPAARFSVKVLSVTSRLAPKTFAMAPPWAMGRRPGCCPCSWERTTQAPVLAGPAQRDGADGANHRGIGGPAVGDGQVADLQVGRAAADAEDAAGIVAADGQTFGSRAVDIRSSVMLRLAAGQGEGAVTSRGGEADQVGAGRSLASAMAPRSEPTPLSARLRTVKVLGTVRSSSGKTLNRVDGARFVSRVGRCPLFAPSGTKGNARIAARMTDA